MKNTLLIYLLLLCNFVQGQNKQEVRVPGTKYSLVPPTGFELSKAFNGFQDRISGSSILIEESPAPYKRIVEGLTAATLKSKGMTLVSKETVQMNKTKASFYKLTQTVNGTLFTKQMLLFGDNNKTVFVIGINSKQATPLEPYIKTALLTIQYDPSLKESPLEAAPFSIDVSGSNFKVVKYSLGSLMFSIDGKIPTKKPTLMVSHSLDKVSVQNKKKFAEERLKKLPGGERSSIYEMNEITIDSMEGYEIISLGKSADNQSEFTFFCLLFGESGEYFVIHGQTKEDFETYKNTFRNISKTFRRKIN